MLDATSTSEPIDAQALRRQVAAAVRQLRARSGQSLAELANAAAIGKSTLHAIESGDANPGIETLWALASALGVPFSDLLEPPSPAVRVTRRGDAPCVTDAESTMHAHLLTSMRHVARVEVYDLLLHPGPCRDADPHHAGTIEHVLVTAGRLRVGPSEATVELDTGDFASFPGDGQHRYEALVEDTRAVLTIEYP